MEKQPHMKYHITAQGRAVLLNEEFKLGLVGDAITPLNVLEALAAKCRRSLKEPSGLSAHFHDADYVPEQQPQIEGYSC